MSDNETPTSPATTLPLPVRVRGLDPATRSLAAQLDRVLVRLWDLGRNMILAWTWKDTGIEIIVVPHYGAETFVATHDSVPAVRPVLSGDRMIIGTPSRQFMRELFSGSRRLEPEMFSHVARLLEIRPVGVRLPQDPNLRLDPTVVDQLIRRYSPSHVDNKAVALIDIVKFSLYSPIEQVTQLNSLAYSLNAAQDHLLRRDISVDFARSTTGDGFYIWNRENGPQANISLFHLVQLMLADNAIARTRAEGNTVPLLRTAFLIGDAYEFYQSEALHPTFYNYLVGEVTIELARLIAGARAGQILIGRFRTLATPTQGGDAPRSLDTVAYMDMLRESLTGLHGVELSGEEVTAVKGYLTGPRLADDSFGIRRLVITDKHGRERIAYNAKMNIYRRNAAPIFLGLQDADFDTHPEA